MAGLLAVLLIVIAIRVQPAINAWRTRRRIIRSFRLQLEQATHPGQIDAWKHPSGEPPPR